MMRAVLPVAQTWVMDTYECIMAQIWMRHVTHVNEACHKCE